MWSTVPFFFFWDDISRRRCTVDLRPSTTPALRRSENPSECGEEDESSENPTNRPTRRRGKRNRTGILSIAKGGTGQADGKRILLGSAGRDSGSRTTRATVVTSFSGHPP